MTTCRRNSSHREITVSNRPEATHTSQAGKKEPRTSKDGARPQLASSKAAQINTRFAFMAVTSSDWPESNPPYGTLGPQARPAPPALPPPHKRGPPPGLF